MRNGPDVLQKEGRLYIIDRAIRLSDGCQIADKSPEEILTGYTTTWYQRNGPCQTLYCDGECGVNNAESIAEFKKLGTTVFIRAPQQHARIAEARQAMLRHVMHMIEEDLKRSGHEIPFRRLYGEALFVVNAFSFYDGVPP